MQQQQINEEKKEMHLWEDGSFRPEPEPFTFRHYLKWLGHLLYAFIFDPEALRLRRETHLRLFLNENFPYHKQLFYQEVEQLRQEYVSQRVKSAWEDFLPEVNSLIKPPSETDRWTWVQTEDGFKFFRQEDGTWDDGDMVFDHCPTDGFFMHMATKRVVQLKACQQKANGLFQLGEIQVSANDMWSLGYRELDGHPGYVGDRPSENE